MAAVPLGHSSGRLLTDVARANPRASAGPVFGAASWSARCRMGRYASLAVAPYLALLVHSLQTPRRLLPTNLPPSEVVSQQAQHCMQRDRVRTPLPIGLFAEARSGFGDRA